MGEAIIQTDTELDAPRQSRVKSWIKFVSWSESFPRGELGRLGRTDGLRRLAAECRRVFEP